MEVGDGGYAFPPYMPDNEESLQDDSSAASLTIARSELLRLLQENAHDFWHVVRRNTSLTASLDSYLQYARSVCLLSLNFGSVPGLNQLLNSRFAILKSRRTADSFDWTSAPRCQ